MDRKKVSLIALALCALMVLGVLVTAITSMTMGAGAASMNDLKDKLSGLTNDKKAVQAEIKDLQNKKQSEIAQKEKLDKEVDIIEQQIETLNDIIWQLEQDLAVTEQELAAAEQRTQEQFETLKTRVRATYEQGGTTSYLDLLLSSQSFSSFLTNMDIVQSIVEYDNKLLDELKATQELIHQKKEEIELNKQQQEESKQELQQTKKELDQKIKEANALIAQLEKESSENEAKLAEIKKAEDAVAAEIDRLMAASNKSDYVGGTFKWPLPGITKITCKFGYRTHPVTGKKMSFHTGVDIGAPKNTPILAANSGTVIISGTSSAYGNYVVVDHGGGWSTMYAHMTKRAVTKGQNVEKGAVLGYVGSTGLSTGNHLHFEIRRNGTSEDPMKHFTKIG